ncbi:MAG: zinc ribbon domain-containing protein [Oscillospiraceae bacterium]|nr:zinc ribbon domain-containing protein [Oscillospiraceae bacterium]
MDERVWDLIDRVRHTAGKVGGAAGNTARSATRRAGNLVDVTKLNLQIFDLNGEVSDLLQEAGRMLYGAHQGEMVDVEAMEAVLSDLDEKNGQIDELKERVVLLKNSRPCPSCGAPCGKEDHFCKDCGGKL